MDLLLTSKIPPTMLKSATEVGAGCRYRLKDAKIGQKLYTTSVQSCSALAMHFKDTNYLAHIDPTPADFNLKKFAENLTKTVRDLVDKYGKAQAVIFGGWELGRVDKEAGALSFDVYNTMATVLDKFNIPLHWICGKKSAVKTTDNIIISGDKVILANKAFEKTGLDNTSDNLPLEKLTEKLSETYSDVELEPDLLNKVID